MQNFFAPFSRRAGSAIAVGALALTLGAGTASACPGADGAACTGGAACEQAMGSASCNCGHAAQAQEGGAGAGEAQKAYIDPATGELASPPAEPADAEGAAAAAAVAAPGRSAGSVQQVPGEGAGVQAELGPGFRSNVSAQRDANGDVHMGCDHGAGTAKDAPADPAH